MAYDSGGSFDDIDMGRPGGFDADTAGAASAATGGAASFLATEAAAMAGASIASEPAGRGGWVGGDGWDAPAPSAPSDGAGLGVFRFFDDHDTYFDRDDDGFLQRGGYVRRRDAPTWSERVGRWFGFGGPRTPTAQGRALAEAALRAYTLHPDACHQSTAEVAAELGMHELDGLAADEQVKAMTARWLAVPGDAAAALANDGTLVVAALALPGNAAHDAIVVPGDGVRIGGRVYPNVCGGGYPFRRSDGSKTAADIWTPRERELVRYFTPD